MFLRSKVGLRPFRAGPLRFPPGRSATVVVLPVKDRGLVWLRVVAMPDRPVAGLLHRLGVILPRMPKVVENMVEKNAL